MKKIMLLLMVVTVAITTKAQVQQDKLSNIDNKGNLLVGGNFKANLTFKSNSSSGGYDVVFSPRLGYYFFKGFAAGIDLNGQYSKEEHQKTAALVQDHLSATTYCRCYLQSCLMIIIQEI